MDDAFEQFLAEHGLSRSSAGGLIPGAPPEPVSEELLLRYERKELKGAEAERVAELVAVYQEWHDAAIRVAEDDFVRTTLTRRSIQIPSRWQNWVMAASAIAGVCLLAFAAYEATTWFYRPEIGELISADVGLEYRVLAGNPGGEKIAIDSQSVAQISEGRGFSILLRPKRDGFATIVRIDGRSVDVLPHEGQDPIRVTAEETCAYGPLIAERNVALWVFVCKDDPTDTIRAICDEIGGTQNLDDTISDKIIDALWEARQPWIGFSRLTIRIVAPSKDQ